MIKILCPSLVYQELTLYGAHYVPDTFLSTLHGLTQQPPNLGTIIGGGSTLFWKGSGLGLPGSIQPIPKAPPSTTFPDFQLKILGQRKAFMIQSNNLLSEKYRGLPEATLL